MANLLEMLLGGIDPYGASPNAVGARNYTPTGGGGAIPNPPPQMGPSPGMLPEGGTQGGFGKMSSMGVPSPVPGMEGFGIDPYGASPNAVGARSYTPTGGGGAIPNPPRQMGASPGALPEGGGGGGFGQLYEAIKAFDPELAEVFKKRNAAR